MSSTGPAERPSSRAAGCRHDLDRPSQLAVRSPADLIAAVPYLLGFHPADSVVAVALRGRQIIFAARADLPEPGADPVAPAAGTWPA